MGENYPDQNQREIPSPGEMRTPFETGNAGERPKLSSSPESTRTSIQHEASEKDSPLESQLGVDLSSKQEKGEQLKTGRESAGDRSAGGRVSAIAGATGLDRVVGAGADATKVYHEARESGVSPVGAGADTLHNQLKEGDHPEFFAYEFGRTSFSHFAWIKGGDLFTNKSPHWLQVTIDMENAGAFSLEIYNRYGRLVDKRRFENLHGGWQVYSFVDMPVTGKAPPGPGQYKFRLVNEAPGKRKVKSGVVSWEFP